MQCSAKLSITGAPCVRGQKVQTGRCALARSRVSQSICPCVCLSEVTAARLAAHPYIRSLAEDAAGVAVELLDPRPRKRQLGAVHLQPERRHREITRRVCRVATCTRISRSGRLRRHDLRFATGFVSATDSHLIAERQLTRGIVPPRSNRPRPKHACRCHQLNLADRS